MQVQKQSACCNCCQGCKGHSVLGSILGMPAYTHQQGRKKSNSSTIQAPHKDLCVACLHTCINKGEHISNSSTLILSTTHVKSPVWQYPVWLSASKGSTSVDANLQAHSQPHRLLPHTLVSRCRPKPQCALWSLTN